MQSLPSGVAFSKRPEFPCWTEATRRGWDNVTQEPSVEEGLSQMSQLISSVARERRERLREEMTRPQPDFILNVSQSEVFQTFELRMMPLAQADPSNFVHSVEETYSCRLAPLDLAPLLGVMSGDELVKLDPGEALERLFRLDSAEFTLSFKNGRFPTRYDFVPIRSISLNYESILVSVQGVSAVAEVVASEVAELLWAAAGVVKRWDDIEGGLQQKAYATGTKVDLGFPLEALLKSPVQDFVTEDIASPNGFGASMGGLKKRHGFKAAPSYAIAATIDELHLKVNRFDTLTGQEWESYLKFSVTSRGDHGQGVCLVSSQLSYENHVSLLEALRKRVMEQ
jgi:hypothetical protein